MMGKRSKTVKTQAPAGTGKTTAVKIVLCGFMGCGKTSVGWRLAKRMKCAFVDMDKYIEEKEGMSVAEIFSRKGEVAFRQSEAVAAKELMKMERVVVASGGGTVLNPANVKAFHAGGGEIYLLDVPVAAIQERLKNDKRRPLLQRPDRRAFIARLYAERYPKYLAAADVIVSAGKPAVMVARDIARRFTD